MTASRSDGTHGLFAIGAKLLGLFLFYLGLQYLLTAFVLGQGQTAPVMVHIGSAAAALGFGLALMFGTDRIGRLVGVGPAASPVGASVDPSAALRTGIILIGLYIFVTRIALALAAVSAHLGGVHFGGAGGAWVRILIDLVPMALAVVFILAPDRIARLITRAVR